MELKLPELGEGVHEGELVRWLVKVGDEVKHDQVLAEIMTDKATVELPSHFSGKVTEITAKEGQTVHVGQTMLKYEGAAGSKTEASKTTAPTASPATSSTTNAPKSAPPVTKGAPAHLMAKSSSTSLTQAAPRAASGGGAPLNIGGAVTAAPATRKLAREMGVDLNQIGSGSGPNGRVLREDLERFIGGTGATSAGAPRMARPAPKRTPGVLEERVPFKGLRKKISEKMRVSKDHAAHFTYVEEADCTNLVEFRNMAKQIGAERGIKVTYLPIIMKAMVAALKKYPILNSSLDEAAGEIIMKNYYNIGLSIQTDDGLTAPVVKDIDNKSILEIAKDIEDVVSRARAKKLTQDDFHGGTITLTNAGTIGGLFATPIINYPEVAILGFNKIFRKPVARMVNGREEIVIRDWTLFSISLDHRIVDGAVGAEFMKLMITYIENPSKLLMEDYL